MLSFGCSSVPEYNTIRQNEVEGDPQRKKIWRLELTSTNEHVQYAKEQ